MKLYTVKQKEQTLVAVKGTDNQLYALSSLGIPVTDMNELILNWDKFKLDIQSKLNDKDAVPLSDYERMAPIITPLQDIVCLGVNYRNHIEETVDVIDFTKKVATVYFSKGVNCCTAPDGIIPNYNFVDKLDYEVELGVILKKDAFQISKEDAADYIFGYTIINDVSARDIQLKHQQWYLGKSLDGYTPMGPCIVTADELTHSDNLNIRCFVNGEKRQDSNTGYMITSINEAIAELSQGMTLKAGTILASGTPGGVGMGMQPPVFLKEGDIIRCEIDAIGTLENTVGKKLS